MKEKTSKIAINPKYDGHKKGLGSMVYKCLTRKQDWEPVGELHKPVISLTIMFGH